MLLAVTAGLLLTAPAAVAHEADPHYDSILTSIRPAVPGLKITVLSRGDRIALVNETGGTVEVPGYKGEPYLRLLPDGTVQENLRSQATYTNQDPKGRTPAPASADATGPDSPAKWRTIDRSSRVEFHDHRAHWMGETGRPAPQVEDTSQRSKVFDWTVPMRVDGKPVTANGTLWWTPEENGFPVAAIIGLVAVIVAGVALVLIVRRRRGDADPNAEDVW